MKTKLFIAIFAFGFKLGFSQEAWTIGPMIHVNFGGEKTHVSYALECACWNFKGILNGFDGGVEFEHKRIRVYSEMQVGMLFAGVAAGPLVEINTGERTAHLGFQSSVWANYILGLDYRKRWVNKTKYNCVGVYVKAPSPWSVTDGSFVSISNKIHDENRYGYADHHHHH